MRITVFIAGLQNEPKLRALIEGLLREGSGSAKKTAATLFPTFPRKL